MNTFQEPLLIIEEEIKRLFQSQRQHVVDINDKLIAAMTGTRFCAIGNGPESAAEVAVDNAEALVTHTHRARVFGRYQDSIRMNRESGTADKDIFEHMEKYVSRALIIAADGAQHQSSSWVTNAQRAAEMSALSDIARLFQDVREGIAE